MGFGQAIQIEEKIACQGECIACSGKKLISRVMQIPVLRPHWTRRASAGHFDYSRENIFEAQKSCVRYVIDIADYSR